MPFLILPAFYPPILFSGLHFALTRILRPYSSIYVNPAMKF